MNDVNLIKSFWSEEKTIQIFFDFSGYQRFARRLFFFKENALYISSKPVEEKHYVHNSLPIGDIWSRIGLCVCVFTNRYLKVCG